MKNPLLFSFIKEFSVTRSMSGKIWRIKVLCGKLKKDEYVKIFGILTKDNIGIEIIGRVNSIHAEVGETKAATIGCAEVGDIVTIDLKNCTYNGYTIDKNEFHITDFSIGVNIDTKVYGYKEVPVLFRDKNEEFLYKLINIQEKRNLQAYESVLLWLGNNVPICWNGIETQKNLIIAYLRILKGQLYIPDNEEMSSLLSRIIIKETCLEKKYGRNRSGLYENIYYKGTILIQ